MYSSYLCVAYYMSKLHPKQYQLWYFTKKQCLQLQIFESTIYFLKNVVSYSLSSLSFPGRSKNVCVLVFVLMCYLYSAVIVFLVF